MDEIKVEMEYLGFRFEEELEDELRSLNHRDHTTVKSETAKRLLEEQSPTGTPMFSEQKEFWTQITKWQKTSKGWRKVKK